MDTYTVSMSWSHGENLLCMGGSKLSGLCFSSLASLSTDVTWQVVVLTHVYGDRIGVRYTTQGLKVRKMLKFLIGASWFA